MIMSFIYNIYIYCSIYYVLLMLKYVEMFRFFAKLLPEPLLKMMAASRSAGTEGEG